MAAQNAQVDGQTVALPGSSMKAGQPQVFALVGESAGKLWQAALQSQSLPRDLNANGSGRLIAGDIDGASVENTSARKSNSSAAMSWAARKPMLAFGESLKPDAQSSLQTPTTSVAKTQARNEKPIAKEVPAKISTLRSDSNAPSAAEPLQVSLAPPAPVSAPLPSRQVALPQKEQLTEHATDGESIWTSQAHRPLGNSPIYMQETLQGSSAGSVSISPMLQGGAVKQVDEESASQNGVVGNAQEIEPDEIASGVSRRASGAFTARAEDQSWLPDAGNGSAPPAEATEASASAPRPINADASGLMPTRSSGQPMQEANAQLAFTGIQQIAGSHTATARGQSRAHNSEVHLNADAEHAEKAQTSSMQPASVQNQSKVAATHPGAEQRLIIAPSKIGGAALPAQSRSAAAQSEARVATSAVKSIELTQPHTEGAEVIGASTQNVAQAEQPGNSSTEPWQPQPANTADAAMHTPLTLTSAPQLESSNPPVAETGTKSEIYRPVLAPQLQQLHVKAGATQVEAAVSDGVHGRIEVSATRTPGGVAATVKLEARPDANGSLTEPVTRAEVGGVSVAGLKEYLAVHQTPVTSIHLEQLGSVQTQTGPGAGMTDLGSGYEQSRQQGKDGGGEITHQPMAHPESAKNLVRAEEGEGASTLHSGRMVSVMA